jgi:hypothetical protein
MKDKKILIISNFYEELSTSRPFLVSKYFEKNNFVTIATADFCHAKKQRVTYNRENIIYLPVITYNKNLSFKRILSHIVFSVQLIRLILRLKPDLIYICIPPNIAGFLGLISGKIIKSKIIIDIIDIWPEALPIPKRIKKLFNFLIGWLWKSLRNFAISASDYVITESDYFYEKVCKNVNNGSVVHLAKLDSDTTLTIPDITNSNQLIIGYLGSISNIYDFKSLINIINGIQNRDIKLVIIGDGEYRQNLLRELDKNNIKYEFYGIVYDEDEKSKLLSQCHFGYNGYKNTTEVALSYKSIEYFSFGIPLINSAKLDTWNIVEHYKVGINFSSDEISRVCEFLKNIEPKDIEEMRKRTYQLYTDKFSWNYYKQTMNNVLRKLNEF